MVMKIDRIFNESIISQYHFLKVIFNIAFLNEVAVIVKVSRGYVSAWTFQSVGLFFVFDPAFYIYCTWNIL